MKRKQLLVVLGLMGVVGLVTACPGEDQDVRKYLAEDGGPNGMVAWEKSIQASICQIEVSISSLTIPPTIPLDPDLRVCPSGTGSVKPAPTYPPAP
jgi:hypothetical protein